MPNALTPQTESQVNISNAHSGFAVSLAFAKQQVSALENLRRERVLSSNRAEFNHVFQLITLLLHCNHPDLPAYVADAPEQIAQFALCDYQRSYLRTLNIEPESLPTGGVAAFDAVYAMGSIGSLSQTSLSDIDLWVCHHQPFSKTQADLIAQKFAKLKQWAKYFNVDISLYLMNPQTFHHYPHNNAVSADHSGSAQHLILLDEFYRSAIRLAGKPLLWWHLRSDNEDYQTTVQQAVARGELNLNDWVDFGGFARLSASEFFGASLWQLYKGIDAPYKSALKILLLESYAYHYPQSHLISIDFKHRLLSRSGLHYHFDPYHAMLDQVSSYLTKRQEADRLECIRYCFYLKANEGDQHDSKRRQTLLKLVEEWGWNAAQLAELDQRPYWKIKQAIRHHDMLVEHLLQSYRHLLSFARKHHIDPSIMPNDADMLMRKLYSVFESLPGKVTLLNPQLRHNLEETAVTFIEVQENAATQSGWYLLNQAPLTDYDSQNRHVQYARTLNKLISWGYFNGLITANTQLHIISKNIQPETFRQFMQEFRLFFPVHAPQISNDDLLHPNEIRSLAVIVNLENDPTATLNETTVAQRLSGSHIFNLSHSQKTLVGSIDIIYRNLWNEIRTQHFSGDNAILAALKFISNKIYRSSAPPQAVKVFCYSEKLRTELSDFISGLVNKCITVQTGKIVARTAKHLPQDNQNITTLFSANSPHPQSKSLDNKHYPREIDAFASEGFVQFFFEDNADDSFNVYILDEHNYLEVYRHCATCKNAQLNQVNRLYTERKLAASKAKNLENFNYPQYYQLLKINGQTQIVPFQSKKHLKFLQKTILQKNHEN